jgi:hypothetical protein
MKNGTIEKGNKLEKAVEEIEKFIFKLNPSLAKSNFKIERKKIVVIDGVKHEIDLYVEIDSGGDYVSIFIFECKNWDHSTVGKGVFKKVCHSLCCRVMP